jgi:hypothetical protein
VETPHGRDLKYETSIKTIWINIPPPPLQNIKKLEMIQK